jgi:hypothetical protein
LSLVVRRISPVAWFSASTFAADTAAPLGSATFPLMAPNVDCAINSDVENKKNNASAQVEETRIIDFRVVFNSVLLTLVGLAKRDWP